MGLSEPADRLLHDKGLGGGEGWGVGMRFSGSAADEMTYMDGQEDPRERRNRKTKQGGMKGESEREIDI